MCARIYLSISAITMTLLLQACSPLSSVWPFFGPVQPKPGKELGWAIAPSWSADSQEIYFVELWADGNYYVKAINVFSREVRFLTENPIKGGNSGHNASRVSTDGWRLYVVIPAPTYEIRDELYRIWTAGGTPEKIRADLAWPWFALSSDQRQIAYVQTAGLFRKEALIVAYIEQGQYLLVQEGENSNLPILPLSFSPDDSRLVYSTSESDVWLFHLPQGPTERIITLNIGRQLVAHDVYWIETEPQILLVDWDAQAHKLSLFQVNGTNSARSLLAIAPQANGLPAKVAWSHDGQQVALWTPIDRGPQCCEGGVCISGDLIHWRLYVWAVEKGWSVAAEAAACEGAAWLAFSPNGRSLGYQLYGKLYVVEQLP